MKQESAVLENLEVEPRENTQTKPNFFCGTQTWPPQPKFSAKQGYFCQVRKKKPFQSFMQV